MRLEKKEKVWNTLEIVGTRNLTVLVRERGTKRVHIPPVNRTTTTSRAVLMQTMILTDQDAHTQTMSTTDRAALTQTMTMSTTSRAALTQTMSTTDHAALTQTMSTTDRTAPDAHPLNTLSHEATSKRHYNDTEHPQP